MRDLVNGRLVEPGLARRTGPRLAVPEEALVTITHEVAFQARAAAVAVAVQIIPPLRGPQAAVDQQPHGHVKYLRSAVLHGSGELQGHSGLVHIKRSVLLIPKPMIIFYENEAN